LIAEDAIESFWAWFAENSDPMSADPDGEVVLEELDRRVADLGCPAWEIGPGSEAYWFLAISPNGDERALPLTQAIVSAAPSVPGWEFLPHRPKKSWDLHFEIEGDSGPIDIDAGLGLSSRTATRTVSTTRGQRRGRGQPCTG
jgi:hypothetical protein